MQFTKMHGIGNDYVYVDCFSEPTPSDPAALARKIADRHFGVGGDGLVLMGPSRVADGRMRMFNADGSEAEMCGNALRCVAKYLFDHGRAAKQQLAIETGNGILQVELEVDGAEVRRVRVDMGPPILAASAIPVALPQGCVTERVVDLPAGDLLPLGGAPGLASDWAEACGLDPRMTAVSMGNPHLILYCRRVAAAPLEAIGPRLETAPIFPRRINVHFVEVGGRGEAAMRTWERGSGITLACGTGAAAVCVAGVLTGRTDRRLLAHLPGGDLELEWSATDDHVYMTGGATEVFSGVWPTEPHD